MPRFFFDFYQSGHGEADELGVELGDAEQAYLEAFRAGAEMWSDMLVQRRDPTFCHFEILDSDR